jgi:F-type H+-transporting ATPase subunit b
MTSRLIPIARSAALACGVLFMQALPALAAEEPMPTGMPQLNPAVFLPQLFWLAIVFIGLYIVLSKVALPRVDAVFDARATRIADDLDKAGALKQQAETAMQAYEKTQIEARNKAAELVRQTEAAMAAQKSSREAQLGRELGDRLKAAETTIAAAKSAALGNLTQMSGEVARAAVERLIGESVSPAEAERITAAIARERA